MIAFGVALTFHRRQRDQGLGGPTGRIPFTAASETYDTARLERVRQLTGGRGTTLR